METDINGLITSRNTIRDARICRFYFFRFHKAPFLLHKERVPPSKIKGISISWVIKAIVTNRNGGKYEKLGLEGSVVRGI